MRKEILTLAFLMLVSLSCWAAKKVGYMVSHTTGAIQSIVVDGDTTGMNWIIRPDGSQYPWIQETDGWGLGYFTIRGKVYRWSRPVEIYGDQSVTYQCADIEVAVKRKRCQDGFMEMYVFTNKGHIAENLSKIGILTPFNDNYPDAQTCVNTRCHAHIWAGGNTTYVCALRMGNYAPHLGHVLTQGRISDYEIWHRGNDKGNSQTRGVIALCPDDMVLSPGQSQTIQWKIFSHQGKDDFCEKASKLGCNVLSAENYLVQPGEQVAINSYKGKKKCVKIPQVLGDYRQLISYGKNKSTYILKSADNKFCGSVC